MKNEEQSGEELPSYGDALVKALRKGHIVTINGERKPWLNDVSHEEQMEKESIAKFIEDRIAKAMAEMHLLLQEEIRAESQGSPQPHDAHRPGPTEGSQDPDSGNGRPSLDEQPSFDELASKYTTYNKLNRGNKV